MPFRPAILPFTSDGIPPARPCIVIAEVAQAHDGSLGLAHAFIDAIARAGADAVKFQTHIAAAESTPAEPWRVQFSSQDKTRYDYWRRMEFTEPQWRGLKSHADEAGLWFLSSPFSLEATDLLMRVGVAGWKVASGEVTHEAMIRRMASTGVPVLLSSGMSTWNELQRAAQWVGDAGAPLAVMQCTSAYPAAPEQIGLNLLAEFRDRFGCPVGLSDHSGTIYPALAAAVLGASVIEVHLTLSREMFGPDVPASITPEELTRLVEGVRFLHCAMRNPVDKDRTADELADLRRTFCKSLVAASDLPAGTILEAGHLATKKPGCGMPAADLPGVLGRVLSHDLKTDQLLQPGDLR
jgi:N-acetylneuraminate synthase